MWFPIEQVKQATRRITLGRYLTKLVPGCVLANHHLLFFCLSFCYTWSTSLNSNLNITYKGKISSKKIQMPWQYHCMLKRKK